MCTVSIMCGCFHNIKMRRGVHVDRQTDRVEGTCRSQSRGWRSGDGGGSGCWRSGDGGGSGCSVALDSAGCDHAIAISPNGHTAGWGIRLGNYFLINSLSLAMTLMSDVYNICPGNKESQKNGK